MATKTVHEIKSAAQVITEDATCQSFIQSSSTLAYACLLIRGKKYPLAAHVLHSLESKQASRFKDMVFYLQVQIGIETGEYSVVKKWLVNKVNQQPNNLVALSLLENCIHLEWLEWQKVENAQPQIVETEKPVTPIGDLNHDSASNDSGSNQGTSAAPSGFSVSSVIGNPLPTNVPLASVSDPADNDFGIYQALVSDENTQALSLRNSETGKIKNYFRNKNLEALVHTLPQILPGTIAGACLALDGGQVQKVCFSFQKLTVTSLHNGEEQLALVTGNINQSLLTMVRAENLFQKQATSARARVTALASAVEASPEVSINE